MMKRRSFPLCSLTFVSVTMDDHAAIHLQERKAASLAAARKQTQLLAAVQKAEVLLGLVCVCRNQTNKGPQVFTFIQMLPYQSAKRAALGRKTWQPRRDS